MDKDKATGRQGQSLGDFISHGAKYEGKLLLNQEHDKDDHAACSAQNGPQ